MWKLGVSIVATTLTVAALAASAAGQSVPEKSCIFAAAQRLPAIPGLSISASRVSGLPDNLKQKASPAGVVSVLVELEVKAAALEATMLFMCSTAPGKPYFVDPLGISR